MNMRRKWLVPFGMWIVFEIVAVTLWLIKDNIFYFLINVARILPPLQGRH